MYLSKWRLSLNMVPRNDTYLKIPEFHILLCDGNSGSPMATVKGL